jgi:hypothetical protein
MEGFFQIWQPPAVDEGTANADILDPSFYQPRRSEKACRPGNIYSSILSSTLIHSPPSSNKKIHFLLRR